MNKQDRIEIVEFKEVFERILTLCEDYLLFSTRRNFSVWVENEAIKGLDRCKRILKLKED